MEVIIVIIIMWAVIAGFGKLMSVGSRAARATVDTVKGKGSFSENLELALKGMDPFEIRFKDTNTKDDGSGVLVKQIEGRGLFSLQRATNVGFIISVFDKTSGELEPIISAIESFQESDNVMFQHSVEVGSISPNHGFPRWVRLGVIIPDILQPPYGGRRQILAVVRMVDINNAPEINYGFGGPTDHPGILWQKSLSFEYTFDEKGYEEATEHKNEALAISLKIGVAIAMADGNLDESEGNILKEWIIRGIEPFSGERQEELKELYNGAMREAYADAKDGNLSLSPLTQRLNEIGDKTTKYETMELCFDVMAADGVANSEGINIIHKVAGALDLDFKEIEKMRDITIIDLDTSVSSHAGIEDLLGIEPDWDRAHVKKFLRDEFQKWNNRLNTLPEGVERDNAQRMLELIAEARKSYE